jgi:hypothetical protein
MLVKMQWIVAIITLFCTACHQQAAATEIPVVEVSTGTFEVPTATPDCQPANGVTMDIQRLSDSKLTLRISGLQPGEIPYIIYSTASARASRMITSGYAVTGASADGKFTIDQAGLIPPEGETSATWDIRLIHSRGVECATITMP